MGTTSPDRLPYPEQSDPVDVSTDMRELAQAVQAALAKLDASMAKQQQDIRVGVKYLGSGRDFKSASGDAHTKALGPDGDLSDFVYTAPSTADGKLMMWQTCSISPRNNNGRTRPLYPCVLATDNTSTAGWSRLDFAGATVDADYPISSFSYTPMSKGQRKTFRWHMRFLKGQHVAQYTLMDSRLMFLWISNAYSTDAYSAVATNLQGIIDLATHPFVDASSA